ncbi:MAG: SH3 domain-containing protein, partial [Chloroflexota bacterium]|nr:SH3 domain-containing protein [Chloroflexota bacterium]
ASDPPPPASSEEPPRSTPVPGATIGPSNGGVPPRPGDSSGFVFQLPAIFGGPMGGVVGPWIALTGVGMAIFWVLLRRRADLPMGMGAAAAPASATGAPGGTLEEAIPRWLRPSLQAARQAGWGVPPPRAAVRFTGPAAPGVDRREIGYRLVRVADGPDDFRSEEIGRFDRGDQVEILESKGPFVRVRGADGLEGWVQQAAIVSILDL